MFVVRTVRRSLQENDLTVLSIFVNPAQFAPHEDLATYPRTLSRDLELLTAQSVSIPYPNSQIPTETCTLTRTPSAVFLPSVSEMYPSGINQDRDTQRGTFVEVKGYGDEMEGKSRPGFFRGVATIVTKLFNVIQVSHLLSQRISISFLYWLSVIVWRIANKHLLRPKRHPTSPPLASSHA
jgi:pantoate--beta-alanine ligase